MRKPAGIFTPDTSHRSVGAVPFDEAVQRLVAFRAAYVLPREAELARQKAQIAIDKRARSNKLKPGEIIGPPDPLAGRRGRMKG